MSATATASVLLKLARPKQWVKNILVVAAPLAGGVLLNPQVMIATLVAFVAFSCAASSIYMINDVLDVEADRAHPKKRFRPVAAGLVAPRTATITGLCLAAASIAIPLIMKPILRPEYGGFKLAAIIVGYLFLQANYVIWLKHQPVLDIATVAGGFLLRAIAGGTAAGVPISKSFLIVVSFGALFMVVGKRLAELVSHEQGEVATRRILAKYTASYLRMLLAVSISVTLIGYTMWAFEIDAGGHGFVPFAAISVIPFALAILRYARDVDTAGGEAPEDAVFADPTLLVLGLLWVAMFVGHVVQP
ncbi:MAG: decaprenyl-phosphate phosphoribosyltransferase [Actinomycetes bacterium]